MAFQEYPKMVYPVGKDPVIVQDRAEENKVLGIPEVDAVEAPKKDKKKE